MSVRKFVNSSPEIPTAITPSVFRDKLSTRQVNREFNDLLNRGTEIRVAGLARQHPTQFLFKGRFRPKHKLNLFDTQFYLTDVFQIPELRFFVACVVQRNQKGRATIFPRIFYKDLSLAWRSASHFAYDEDGDLWIGKGAVGDVMRNGFMMIESIESTTDLPIEMQSGLEALLTFAGKAKTGNERILEWVLRQGSDDRVEPYFDFVKPRRVAASNPRNLINRGRSIARFTRKNDPGSLRISAGYEPDFEQGIIERSTSQSTLYGGKLQRFRILSMNRKIQYYFFAGSHQVWLMPPQATTTQISSYGVRTIDVVADDNLFIPGYEYHHLVETENGNGLYSQIPTGFAGEVCPFDDAKADASPWLDKIPVIIEFRKRVFKRR